MGENTAATSHREATFARRERATATRIGSVRACSSAAPTTACPTSPKVATCGIRKTIVANLVAPPRDLVAKERVLVYQVNTQCARRQGILQEKPVEWFADGRIIASTGPGSLYNVSPTTLRAMAMTGITRTTHVADETATSTTHAAMASGAVRGTASARPATSASCTLARSSASAWTSTSAQILAFPLRLSPTADQRRPAPTITAPSPVRATVDTLAFKLALVALI